MAQWINGSELAKQIQAEVAVEVRRLQANGVHPALAVVLVGDNPASQVYVRGKVKNLPGAGHAFRKDRAARHFDNG